MDHQTDQTPTTLTITLTMLQTQEAIPLEATLLDLTLQTDLPTALPLEATPLDLTLHLDQTVETPLVLLAALTLTLIPEPLELLTHPSSPTSVLSLSSVTELHTTDVPLMLSFLPTDACNSLGALFPLMPTET
jgi:hypothetical protein